MENYDIAVDARMIDASGIGTYLQNILPALSRSYNIILLGDEEKLKSYSKKVKHFNAPIYSLKELVALPFNVPECTVFWSPHFNVPLFQNKAKYRVTTIHDTFHLAFFNRLNLKQKVYAKAFYNIAVRHSDSIITVSEHSKQEIIRYTSSDPEKIHVIYNGVQQETFAAPFTEHDAEAIATKYTLPRNYILYVGNVKPHKNLNGLVHALKDLFVQEQDLHLVVAGKKEGFITGDNNLTELINSSPLLHERVVFTGYVAQEDLPYLYQQARLFVMPSLYEGFGLPPLEAMSANTLAVVSNKTSLPEVCKDGALYFDPYDPDSIRSVIAHALHLPPAEKDGMKAKAQLISKSFAWQSTIQQHLNLFNEYIG